MLCTANFMVILDSQIVLLAPPSIDRAPVAGLGALAGATILRPRRLDLAPEAR